MRKSRVMRVTTRAAVRGPPPGNPGGRGPPTPSPDRPSFSFSAKGKEESRGEGGTPRFDRNIKRTDVTRLVAESRGRPAASDPYWRIEGRGKVSEGERRFSRYFHVAGICDLAGR